MALLFDKIKLSKNIKYAGNLDYCECCVNKELENSNKDKTTIINSFKGKIKNQKVFYITIHGIDYCICKDCLKELIDKLSEDNQIQEQPQEVQEEKEEKEDIKKTSKKTK